MKFIYHEESKKEGLHALAVTQQELNMIQMRLYYIHSLQYLVNHLKNDLENDSGD